MVTAGLLRISTSYFPLTNKSVWKVEMLPGHTVPFEEQSDQGLHCFPFCYYTLNTSSDQPVKYGQHVQIKKFSSFFKLLVQL